MTSRPNIVISAAACFALCAFAFREFCGGRGRSESGRYDGRPHVLGRYGADEETQNEEAYERGFHDVRPHGAGSAKVIVGLTA